jgi:DNA-directed RNA polymerase III subunit RPC3
MSSSKVALAEHILYEHFGAAVGVLGGILLARGRLSYETILRLLPRSTFKQATAQAALLVLVQHNCLYYVQDEEEGTEYFEMNLEAILQRRRYGQFMALTREHWGKRAFEVLQQVLVDGKSKLSNLLEDCSHLADRTQTIKAIYDLLDAGVLQPVKASDQTSVEDQDLQLEKQMMREFKGPPTPKDLKQIKIDVEDRREKLRAEPRTWGKDHMSYVATCLGDEGEEPGNNYGNIDSSTGQVSM